MPDNYSLSATSTNWSVTYVLFQYSADRVVRPSSPCLLILMGITPQPTPTDAQPDDELAAYDGTPHYGDFGHPADPKVPRHYQALTNDGSNDNPDGFSAFRGKHAASTEYYCMPEAIADPNLQRGHVEQNQHPEATAVAQGGDDAEEHAAYALGDPRYAGGDVYDLKDEQTSL